MKSVLASLLKDFPNDIRFIYRHFPLPMHDKAALAAQASEAAGLQGEFWAMYDLLYGKTGDWVSLTTEEFEDWVTAEAETLGLDAEEFYRDLFSDEIAAFVEKAYQNAVTLGIPQTPYLLVDNSPLTSDMYSYGNLKSIMEIYLIPLGRLTEKQFSECPDMNIDPTKQYTATLYTEKGNIVIALYPDIAPFAVNNFIFLARNDYYDNVTFHRVIEGFIAQAGDPSGTGSGFPGYMFSIEVSTELKFDRAGLFAMANAGPTSNGSQFFITYDAAPDLDGQYTIFGEVVEGMEVVESLTLRNPQAAPFAPPGDLILDVTIEEK